MVFKKAVRGFQEARGLEVTGSSTARPGRIDAGRAAVDGHGQADPRRYQRRLRLSLSKEPEDQAKLKGMSYRNMIEEVAERYHTTPKTLIALNGPTALIGVGQTLRLPNVIPTARDYSGFSPNMRQRSPSRTSTLNQPAVDHIVVDKSEGVLKVIDKADKLVAQFPVTMGSSKIRCRSARGRRRPTPYPAFPLSARPVLGCRRQQGRAAPSAGAEWPGRSGVARPHQGALWHPRHARATTIGPAKAMAASA